MRPLAVAVVALARVCGAEAPCDTPHACEPVILVPGIMGSRLRQHSREPGTLKTVTKHTWLPESHRLLTRSAVLGPVSSAGHSSWVNSLSSNYRRPGLRIEPDRSNWGLKGVSCILKTGNECVASAKVFWDMVQALEKAGYRAGSTLYGVPFDWRLPPTENKLCADLARVLHHVTNTTHHRKALVVAHSLGNLQLLHCFQSVFGSETLSRIKALVAVAAPWAGAPQMLRVLFSGAEMVSRLIISDAETRDFSRQMQSSYMLIPDERVWANRTVIHLANARGGGGGGAGSGSADQEAESYRGSRAELAMLFAKMAAFGGPSAKGMVETYAKSLRVVDVWKPPPVPVVCVIGSGRPTHVSFGYCDRWPHNMDEAPCVTRFEDGDQTVPVLSATSVCDYWQDARKCWSPLGTVHPTHFSSRRDKCVETVHFHCRAANMESADAPKGAEHCAELHQKILGKQPLIDLVHSLSLNPRAFEPAFSAVAAQIDELGQLVAWHFNSAVRRLPTPDSLRAALGRWSAGNAEAQLAPPKSVPDLTELEQAWLTLKDRASYEKTVSAIDLLREAVMAAEREAAAAQVAAGAEAAEAARGGGGGGGAAGGAAAAAALDGVGAAVRPLAYATRQAASVFRALEEGCVGGGRDAGPSAGSRPAGAELAEDAEAHPLCAEADAASLGLPESAEAWERAQHRFLTHVRRSSRGGFAERRAREHARRWSCSLRAALAEHEAGAEEAREHLEWVLLHLQRLEERMSRPEPPNAQRAEGPPAHTSALYGNMGQDT